MNGHRLDPFTPRNVPAVPVRAELGHERRREVAKAARQQPGVWLDLSTGVTQKTTHSRLWLLRHKPGIVFQPDRVGSFEFRSEKREDGYAIQVRYIRNSPESPRNTPGSPSPAVGVAAADGEVPDVPSVVPGTSGTENA